PAFWWAGVISPAVFGREQEWFIMGDWKEFLRVTGIILGCVVSLTTMVLWVVGWYWRHEKKWKARVKAERERADAFGKEVKSLMDQLAECGSVMDATRENALLEQITLLQKSMAELEDELRKTEEYGKRTLQAAENDAKELKSQIALLQNEAAAHTV